MVGTSNRIPKDLYASNVQRGQLTQFLEILQESCRNHEMRSNLDFRRQPFYRQQWLDRNAPDQDAASDATSSTGQAEPASAAAPTAAGVSSYFLRFEADKFNALVDDAVARRIPRRATLDVYGRKLVGPRSYAATNSLPSVCRFTFSELCDSPLGPADYLTLASSYHTLIVEDVPQMTLMQKNQARRMITLLDAVYEAGCRLIVLADAAPDDLFFPDAEKAARHAAAVVLAERAVYFAPSLALIRQTVLAWFTHGEPSIQIEAMCVCSDETVADDIPRTELPVPVTTDSAEVARFLSQPLLPGTRRILFATYHSAGRVEEAFAGALHDQPEILPGLVLCDEAHRVAGPDGKKFQAVLDVARIPGKHRVFLTATPRIVAAHHDREEAYAFIASMDD